MFSSVETLENLSIQSVSKRLDRIKEQFKYEDDVNVQLALNVGDRLFYNYLSNTDEEGVDEECLKFILKYFRVNNFHIYPRKFGNIEYFDFLNGQEFHELYIYGQTVIKIKDINNFSLKIQNLNLHRTAVYKWNREFFSKCNVTDTLICNGGIYNDELPINNLHEIIEYSSPDLRKIFIENAYIAKSSLPKLKRALKNKKNLEIIYPSFEINRLTAQDVLKTTVIRDGLLPSSKTLTSFSMNHAMYFDWDYKIGNELFKSLSCLKELKFWFIIERNNFCDMVDFFNILRDKQSKTLRKIEFLFNNSNRFRKSLNEFLKKCKFLEEVTIEERSILNENEICDSLISSAKNLKSINLPGYNLKKEVNFESMKNLLSMCQLQNINIDNYKVNDSTFKGLLQSLENSKNHITSFSVTSRKLNNKQIEMMANFLSCLKNLKNFSFLETRIPKKQFGILTNALKDCCENLEILNISRIEDLKEINGVKVVELIRKCNNLHYVKLGNINLNDCFDEFFNALSNSLDVLEKLSLGMLIKTCKGTTFTDFLLRCQNLEHLRFEIYSFTDDDAIKFRKFLQNNKCKLKYLVPIIDDDTNCEFTPEFFNDFPRVQLLSTFFHIDEYDCFPYHFHNLYEDTDE